jgi:hypothetical protein
LTFIVFDDILIVKGIFVLILIIDPGESEGKMGSPDKIKVDTEQLRTLAKGYVTRSGVVNDTWNSTKLTLGGIVRRMPAYDGRLQKAANQDILDFTTRSREFFGFFQDDSASLIIISEAFEYVDGQTVKVIQDADDITRASLIDAGAELGDNSTITEEVITSPDGSVTVTKTTIRTVNPDGTVTTKTIVQISTILDEETAAKFNKSDDNNEKANIIAGFILGLIPGYGTIVGGITAILDLHEVDYPPRDWQAGDTITYTITTETTTLPGIPDDINPSYANPESPPDITIETEVKDASGEVILEEKYKVDPSGAKYYQP